MTTIHFERTGGLLGKEIDFDLDLNQLPDEASQQIQRLILDADFHRIPADLYGKSTPDEFEYVITVRAGQSEHTVRTCDTTMPDALSPLVAELTGIHAEQEKESIRSSR
jgi:hypothetical protein